MVHNIHINGGNEVLFIHFIGYHMAKLAYKKIIELVYLLQLFNKKIISTSFKTRKNAFIMQQIIAWHNVYFLKIYKWYCIYLALFHVWFFIKHSLCAL